ncbi:MAG: DMT family transporter [Bacteroidales bacterium]|nr:DMT family transporter [Bacteroidales bacterium]
MNSKNLSYLFAGLTILFWGTAASAFKLTLEHLTNVQLLAWASLSSTAILLLIILLTNKGKELRKLTWKQSLPSLYLGLINPFAYYLILFKAYELLPAQVAQPLNFIWPLVLVLLSVPLLGEKITAKGIVALLVSFIGVILISSEGNITNINIESPLGVFLALFSAVVWALYWILNLRNTGVDPTIRLFINFAFATVFAFALGVQLDGFWKINLPGLGGAFYVGCFEMGITFFLWLKALALAESKAKLGNIIYLVPFLSLILIHFLVREDIYWTTIAGLVVIVSSILYQQISGSNKKIITP